MCLLAAASAGWDLADVRRAVSTAPGMEHFRTKNTGRGARRARNPREAAERLERQWDRAQQYAALHAHLPAERTAQDLSVLDGIVADVADLLDRFRVSPGRWGKSEASSNDRTVLTAIAYLTLRTGKPSVAASIRDLSALTGLGRTTAARALTALEAGGYLTRTVASDGGNASEWRLHRTLSTGRNTVRSQPLNNPRPPTELFNQRSVLLDQLEHELTDSRHDLFTRGGLGHLAGKVYALLRTTPSLTIVKAAQLLGVSTGHTTTILSRLRAHRLVTAASDGWTRAKRDLRKAAAQVLGVDGYLADRKRRYALEREVWAWWQAEVDHRSSSPGARVRRAHPTSRPLFEPSASGERVWPLYPRDSDGRGNHREAYRWSREGMLEPGFLWWSSTAA